MTPAEVIKVMGFEGERLESVSSDFSVSITMIFRESSRKRITVNFNRNQRASSKGLVGIQLITLEKYQAIKIGAAEGSTMADVNRIMGFEGSWRRANSTALSVTYRWAESADRFVEVDILNVGPRRAVAARASGLPGAKAKP